MDWHPWGEEAFEKARREDKLIFLSIGYSTCHWYHVMAHESFEDPEVACLMNDRSTLWRPYLEKVVYRYLDCGDLHNGFARVKCKDCGHEYLLAFSCKRRHFVSV